MQGSDFANKLRPAVPGGPVLEYERAKSCLPVEELSISLLGKEYLIRQTRILKLLESDPLFNKARQLNLSRPDRFKLILLRAKTLRRMFVKYKWSEDDFKMAEYLVDDIHPYILHSGMFTVTVREQASEEQIAKWLPRIENWDFVGCYAQTELGHGSNVRGLETTAKYDPETKEFIIHSPTVTASKWWNGGMGKLASHAIVVAQLLMPEGGSYKNYGVLPFFIQIRDLKTRKPLPGIVIGDIGPKYGYPGMDNGFMLFNEKR
jgi:acyl-CoA oxidase